MGAILASAIIDEVEKTLFDDGNDRWDATTEHLVALNNCSRAIVSRKPESYVTIESIPLVAGTKQTIPAGRIRLIDVTRNMGTDGLTPGKIITRISKEDLDNFNPNWHTVTASAVVDHYIHNENNPKIFYVYPPQPSSGTGQVEGSSSDTPPEVAIGVAIPLDDIYKNAYKNYMLHQAYQKSTSTQDIERSRQYFTLFLQEIGSKEEGENKIEFKHGNTIVK